MGPDGSGSGFSVSVVLDRCALVSFLDELRFRR